MAIGLDEASLVSLIVAAFFFGILTVLFLVSLYILLYKRRQQNRLDMPVLAVSCVMYILALLHVISLGIRAVNAFIKNRNIDGGPYQYYVVTANSSYLLQVTTYAAQTLIGDGFLLYRLYVVWEKDNRILVFASIFWMGGIVSGIGTLVHEATASPTTPIFVFKAWITSFFVITLFTNLTATSLIAGKIWISERRTSGFMKSHTLSPILIIVIESGAAYSISLIALLATFLISNWGQYVVLDPIVPLIGITFTLIIVRIGLGLSPNQATWNAQANEFAPGSSLETHRMRLRNITVHVAQDQFVCEDDGKEDGSSNDVESSRSSRKEIHL